MKEQFATAYLLHEPSTGDHRRVHDQTPRIALNLPQLQEDFVGREKELALLLERVTTKAFQTTVMSGLGGVGKSALARAAVAACANDFDVVAWAYAGDRGFTDLLGIANSLGLPVDGVATADQLETVLHWLRFTDKRWLLVLDDVLDNEYLRVAHPASGNGHVLVTTRDRVLYGGATLHLESFDLATSVTLLQKRSGRTGDVAVIEVADVLQGFPLAIAHAANYCSYGTTFDEYLHLMEKEDTSTSRVWRYSEIAGERVARTVRVSIQAAISADPLAESVLKLVTYFAPRRIPKSLIAAGIVNLIGSVTSLVSALNTLARFDLISWRTRA